MDKDILKEGLIEYGYSLKELEEEKFLKFSELLIEWNKKINLTSITSPAEISVKHFLDSLIPLFLFDIKENSKIIDVGTGAGFPGIPIKILRPDINFTFLDSLNKRINFLKEVSKNLGFDKVEFLHMRAEDAGKNNELRGMYDYAVSRAVAPLKILSEYCIPFLKIGGIFAAFKAFDIEEEIKEARPTIGVLGGKIRDIKEVKIPKSDIKRKIVLIEKVKETPKEFPRRSNKIK